jgi:ribonuclease T2
MKIKQALQAYWLCTLSLILFGCQNSSNPASQPAATIADARIANARAANDAGVIPTPTGHFDYYLLTLSWAPEYCHGHSNSPECDGSHPGFVVHGLWPQFQDGQWPSQCSAAPGLSNPTSMLDIMPAPRLIAHEWPTHGTCTGLTANQYFAVVRQAYQSIKIPAALVNPTQTSRQSAAEIKQLFVESNPAISTDDIAISCHNRYLAGVEFCLSKTLQPIACQTVRDCNASSITIPSGR